MLIPNTDKKLARKKSKSKNTELKKIENRAKQMIANFGGTTCTMNEEKQVKKISKI